MNGFSKEVFSGACHEAGHAIAACHLGLVIREASFTGAEVRGGASCGYVDSTPGGVFDAYVAVAGCVAQLRAVGQKESFFIFFQAQADYNPLRELFAPYLDKAHFEAYRRKLEDDVAGFLYQRGVWEYVSRFAKELLLGSPLPCGDCMRLTDEVPRAKLVEIQQIMLSPTFHNHMGRRVGHAKRLELERMLREAVEAVRPAFGKAPSFDGFERALMEEGYSEDEAEKLRLELSSFWPQPDLPG